MSKHKKTILKLLFSVIPMVRAQDDSRINLLKHPLIVKLFASTFQQKFFCNLSQKELCKCQGFTPNVKKSTSMSKCLRFK